MLSRIIQWYKQDAGHIVLGVIMLICLMISFPRVYATDEVQYYAWMRSVWFDHDVNFQNEYETFAQLNPQSGIANSLLQPNRIRPLTGLYGNIAPVGSAMLWTPWFIATDIGLRGLHTIGFALHIPADGYSWPYQRAVCYASAIYAFVGLLVCYRLTREWFPVTQSLLATSAIWLATPLVYYMTIQMPFAHANGFFVSSCFVWLWWKSTQAASTWRTWALLGICGGMLYLVREQLILFVMLPVVSTCYQLWQSLPQRRIVWRQIIVQCAIAVICLLAIITPQFIAYWAVNGTPAPAREVASKLNLCSPHAIDTLVDFDPRPEPLCNVGVEPVTVPAWSRGALVWSPILLFALIGLVIFARRNPLVGGAMILAVCTQIWINGAFGTTWHLSGAFGFRRFIECSPFFIVGAATCIAYLQQRIPWRVVVLCVVLLMLWNFGLIINATIFNNDTQLRRGLSWPQVWEWQFTLPQRMWERSHDLFDRCKLIKNRCS